MMITFSSEDGYIHSLESRQARKGHLKFGRCGVPDIEERFYDPLACPSEGTQQVTVKDAEVTCPSCLAWIESREEWPDVVTV